MALVSGKREEVHQNQGFNSDLLKVIIDYMPGILY